MPQSIYYDTATGHPVIEPVYLRHLGAQYVFDRLTLTLWMTSFPTTCPLSGIQIKGMQSMTLADNSIPSTSSPLAIHYPKKYRTYKELCHDINSTYHNTKNHMIRSIQAYEKIPHALFIIGVLLTLHALCIVPPLLTTVLTLLMTFLTLNLALVWIAPQTFTEFGDMDKIKNTFYKSWIRDDAKALVAYWQICRYEKLQETGIVDLGIYKNNPQTKRLLETMRTLLADTYLSVLNSRYLGPYKGTISSVDFHKRKYLWPQFLTELKHLYTSGLPPIHHSTTPLQATALFSPTHTIPTTIHPNRAQPETSSPRLAL